MRKVLVPTAGERPRRAGLGAHGSDCMEQIRMEQIRRASGFMSLISAKFASAKEDKLGRAILLWLLGVPIPIIILIALLYH
jgi:hypothetical protein